MLQYDGQDHDDTIEQLVQLYRQKELQERENIARSRYSLRAWVKINLVKMYGLFVLVDDIIDEITEFFENHLGIYSSLGGNEGMDEDEQESSW